MRKFKVIAGWTFVIAYLIVSLSFIGDKKALTPCHYIKIDILDSLYNGFVTKQDISRIIEKSQGKILGYPISNINTKKLEKKILENRAIGTCDIYKTADGSLHVDVQQREPILRVINNKNESYYISREGFLIPFSSIQTPNVIIANGEISENFRLDLTKHDHVKKFNIANKENLLSDLQQLSLFIHDDPFWNSQFVQIYVNKKREIELIPRVGAHIIILGKTDNFQLKLKKLKALYVQGLNNLGWNNYETINLKYKNQVICSKR